MKGWIKNLVKLFLVVSIVIGTTGAILHASESVSDLAHHQTSCELCAVYQTLSSGLTVVPILIALVLAIAAVRALRIGQQELAGIEILAVSFCVDPPPVILNS